MYADRYAKRRKLDPGSLGLSAVLVGTIMAGMIFSAPDIVKKLDPRLKIVNIVEPPVPPPEPAKPLPETKQTEIKHITPTFIPDPVVKTAETPQVTFAAQPTLPTTPSEGTGSVLTTLPAKPPVLIGPGINPRFNYQPDYPSDERRLGREGRVVVRVLVGTDGRVKQVEKVSAASDSFFEATRKRALEKWRLTPGTRDGVPIEAWRTMAVSFVMTEE
ncbi:MAG: TonB family protein [Pseudomonadota bacterium]